MVFSLLTCASMRATIYDALLLLRFDNASPITLMFCADAMQEKLPELEALKLVELKRMLKERHLKTTGLKVW
jgi:hypothetical protein